MITKVGQIWKDDNYSKFLYYITKVDMERKEVHFFIADKPVYNASTSVIEIIEKVKSQLDLNNPVKNSHMSISRWEDETDLFIDSNVTPFTINIKGKFLL